MKDLYNVEILEIGKDQIHILFCVYVLHTEIGELQFFQSYWLKFTIEPIAVYTN